MKRMLLGRAPVVDSHHPAVPGTPRPGCPAPGAPPGAASPSRPHACADPWGFRGRRVPSPLAFSHAVSTRCEWHQGRQKGPKPPEAGHREGGRPTGREGDPQGARPIGLGKVERAGRGGLEAGADRKGVRRNGGGRVLPAPLRGSVGCLHQLCRGLDDAELEAQSYGRDRSIAGVLSHLGLGGVIMRRRLEDLVAGRTPPDDLAPSVWDEWNAKSARAKADDALVVDEAMLEALEAVSARTAPA